MQEVDVSKVPISELILNFHHHGQVEWIGLRPARKQSMQSVATAQLEPGLGLKGDRFKGTLNSKRQVSFIQSEHLQAMALMLGVDVIAPELLRRNIVVAGVNLLSLKGMRFSLGSAVLEMSCLCHPCSRMEQTFGPGGYNLVRGHGGILAKVISPGEVSVGDKLDYIRPIER